MPTRLPFVFNSFVFKCSLGLALLGASFGLSLSPANAAMLVAQAVAVPASQPATETVVNPMRPAVVPASQVPTSPPAEPKPVATPKPADGPKPAAAVTPAKPATPSQVAPVPVVKPPASASPAAPTEPTEPTDKKPAEQPAKPAATAMPKEKASNPPAATARLRSEQLLPGYTKAWVSIPDMASMRANFKTTQFGQLANDAAIEPFIKSLEDQFKKWADQKNVRLGVKIENLDQIYSGEICLAGAVPALAGQQTERNAHGLILLVDVRDSQEQAAKVLADINGRLVKQGAVQETLEINGATVTRSTIGKPKRLRASQTTMQAIYDGWLLASDNEKIFRDVLFRLATTKAGALKTDALAAQESFKAVMTQTDLGESQPHVRWYVDPFGYIRLAQALADDEKESREQRDDWARILQGQGFDAIKAAGGMVSFSTGSHEVLHRTFVYAPQQNLTRPEQKRVFGLFDFTNKAGQAVEPADWVPNDVSAFFVGKWNFASALENVGYLYDAFLDDPGAFERVMQDFKNDPDMQLNIRKLIDQLDHEWTVVSATQKPIGSNSERVAIAFKLKKDADGKFVLESIRRAIGRGNATMITLGGKSVIEVDSKKLIEDDEIPDDLFSDPLADESFGGDGEEEEEEFTLFDKKYFAIQHGYLIVANNKDYLKRIFANKQSKKLVDTTDYRLIHSALDKLVDGKVISSRQFGRLDKALEANYELLRSGKIESSNTVLAKIANKIFKERQEDQKEAGKDGTVARLNASKLPADYSKTIAPFLGVTGWANEVKEDGWRISGCVLKRAE